MSDRSPVLLVGSSKVGNREGGDHRGPGSGFLSTSLLVLSRVGLFVCLWSFLPNGLTLMLTKRLTLVLRVLVSRTLIFYALLRSLYFFCSLWLWLWFMTRGPSPVPPIRLLLYRCTNAVLASAPFPRDVHGCTSLHVSGRGTPLAGPLVSSTHPFAGRARALGVECTTNFFSRSSDPPGHGTRTARATTRLATYSTLATLSCMPFVTPRCDRVVYPRPLPAPSGQGQSWQLPPHLARGTGICVHT